MKNKKYCLIITTLLLAFGQIFLGLSSNAFAQEDDMVLAAKAATKLQTSIKVEHGIVLDSKLNETEAADPKSYDGRSSDGIKNDMYTSLIFRLIIGLPKNFQLMLGADPQISLQQTNPNQDQITLSTAPFVNVSYRTGLKAGPFAWNSVNFGVSSTTPGSYKTSSLYASFSVGTTLSFVPASFMEIYYVPSFSKYINKYENNPYGSNTTIKASNSLTVQFNILQGLKYCQNLSLSMGLAFSNKMTYEGTWIGQHSTSLTLSYTVIPEFSVYAYFYSYENNFTPDGDSNFSLYHRNTSSFYMGVGSTF